MSIPIVIMSVLTVDTGNPESTDRPISMDERAFTNFKNSEQFLGSFALERSKPLPVRLGTRIALWLALVSINPLRIPLQVFVQKDMAHVPMANHDRRLCDLGSRQTNKSEREWSGVSSVFTRTDSASGIRMKGACFRACIKRRNGPLTRSVFIDYWECDLGGTSGCRDGKNAVSLSVPECETHATDCVSFRTR